MNPAIDIRLASAEDAGQLATLIRELGYALSPAQLCQKLTAMHASQSDRVLVAAVDDRLLGCIALHAMPLLHADGHLGRITALVVTTTHRGQGIGSALMQAAQSWFEAVQCTRFEVTSGDQRVDAHRFYERHGYARQGQRLLRVRRSHACV